MILRGTEPSPAPVGRRIGFVDDHLDNYHANVFLQALRGPLKERGFTVTGCTGLKEPDGRAWAEKNAVPYFRVLLNFTGERTGVVNVYPQSNTPFAASVTTEKATQYIQVDSSKIFVSTAAAVLDFFQAGKPRIDRRETLMLMRILDAAKDPRAVREFVALG